MFEAHENGDYLVQLENGVLRVSFNRPKFGNAIGQTMVPGLVQLFRDAQESVQVRSILIRGEGKIFSAGGDVAGFVRSLEQDVPSRQADFSRRLSNLRVLVETVLAFDRPIVVSVRGAAAGAGLLYPLAADYVIGDPTALFIFAHQGVALCPDGGVSALLPQVVGQRMARSLVLTAARVKADEALRLGHPAPDCSARGARGRGECGGAAFGASAAPRRHRGKEIDERVFWSLDQRAAGRGNEWHRQPVWATPILKRGCAPSWIKGRRTSHPRNEGCVAMNRHAMRGLVSPLGPFVFFELTQFGAPDNLERLI